MEDQLLKGIRKLNHGIYEAVSVDLDPRKRLNFTQMQIINYLKRNKKVCQKDLEVDTHLNKASISAAISSLEKGKLINRMRDEDDGRKNIIVLTPEARKQFDILDARLEEVKQKMNEGISKKELDAFEKTMNKMILNLKEAKK